MKKNRIKPFVLVALLIVTTCFAMAWADKKNVSATPTLQTVIHKNGIVSLSGSLTQTQIYAGGDGLASLALTLDADDIRDAGESSDTAPRHVDMVIVLDRSGSMAGKKIADARTAALNLIADLSPADRFALVTYSGQAARLSGLEPVTPSTRRHLSAAIGRISAGGGTNLGQGLKKGIDILTGAEKIGNQGRLILISDGLANQGITDVNALAALAAIATDETFSISTVGLGYDFNEQLMTAIADLGTGTYYYLENPAAFASVFQKELHRAGMVAATAVKIRVPEQSGLKLVAAGGYPISRANSHAVFYPGDLQSGETRKLFLTVKVPTGRAKTFRISGIDLSYRFQDVPYTVKLNTPLTLACVKDPAAAVASIDKETWGYKVIKEDFNRLREEVAKDIKTGKPATAMKRIDAYRATQQAINEHVQSEAVAGNLEKDLTVLRATVADTFSGAESDVKEKQKKNAKAIQYEGYSGRRSSK